MEYAAGKYQASVENMKQFFINEMENSIDGAESRAEEIEVCD
jgi:hypothetical protein